MKRTAPIFLSVILLALGVQARADTLELKNGTVLQGKYLGGTADTVRFETSSGLQILEYSQVRSMSVSPAAAKSAPAPAAAPVTVVIPAGTVLMVQFMDSVSSKSSPGTNFSTRMQYNLVAGNRVVVPAGTVVYGQVVSATQAGRLFGQSTLDVRLTQMVLNGSPVQFSTSSYIVQGEHEGMKSAAAAGAGAIIGNNTGGSGGSGAAWGLAAAALRPGQTLTIPPGALVQFSLTSPVTFSLH